MIDSRTAAQVGYFGALNTTAAVTALADVWAPPPEGTEPTAAKGVVIVGLSSITNAGGKDGGLDEVETDILVYVRNPDPTALYGLSAKVRDAVEGQDLVAPGALIDPPEFISAESDLMEDGKTFFDTLKFRSFVQPA